MSAHSGLDVIQLPCVHVHEIRQCARIGLNTVYGIP